MSSVPVGDTVLQQDPHNINSRLKKKKKDKKFIIDCNAARAT